MVLKAKSKIFQNRDAKTQYITIPASIASDSQYPFTAGQEIEIIVNPDNSKIEILFTNSEKPSETTVHSRSE
jgi:c-di-GMP-binding flagellar brake protein YcgR